MNNQPNIFFIGDRSLQSAAFSNLLCNELNLNDLGSWEQTRQYNGELVIFIDMNAISFDKAEIKHFIELDPTRRRLVLLNVNRNEEFQCFMEWPSVMGIFRNDEELELLMRGITRIMSGEIWISRELSSKLIGHYRVQSNEACPLEKSLTMREMEILQKMMDGASNADIADTLNVSIFTVKTHIYNLFKKLSVKNRAQATQWANRNLFKRLS